MKWKRANRGYFGGNGDRDRNGKRYGKAKAIGRFARSHLPSLIVGFGLGFIVAAAIVGRGRGIDHKGSSTTNIGPGSHSGPSACSKPGARANLNPTPGIFFTTKPTSGGMGGSTGADRICMEDPLVSSMVANQCRTYKAMIYSTGASGQPARNLSTNWVFRPKTTYMDIRSGEVVGTTDSKARLTFPLKNGVSVSTAEEEYWTGLKINWERQPLGSVVNGAEENLCKDWTSSEHSDLANVGRLTDIQGYSFLEWYPQFCDRGNVHLLCVEQ